MSLRVSDPLAFASDVSRACSDVGDAKAVASAVEAAVLTALPPLDVIPSLNTCSHRVIPAGSLVRFCCFVQDTLTPELFMSACTVHREAGDDAAASSAERMSCLYREQIVVPPNAHVTDNALGDRQTLHCVSIPGATPWLRALLRTGPELPELGAEALADEHRMDTEQDAHAQRPVDERKRVIGTPAGDDTMADVEQQQQQHAPLDSVDVDDGAAASASVRSKRAAAQSAHDDAPAESAAAAAAASAHTARTAADVVRAQAALASNHPVPSEDAVSALVKVYGERVDRMRIGTMIEVLGVLVTEFVPPTEDELMGEELYGAAAFPPPSQMPRVHALAVRPLSIADQLASVAGAPKLSASASEWAAGRDLTLAFLTDMCGGDRLLAHYLLFALLSRVDDSGPASMRDVRTRVRINLIGVSAREVEHVRRVLATVAPCVHRLALSVSSLNANKLAPRKDHDSDTIVASELQLPGGSVLIVDETGLQPGTLTEAGLTNVSTLRTLIARNQLTYDFQYHQQPMPTDITSILMSDAMSMFASDVSAMVVDAKALSHAAATVSADPASGALTWSAGPPGWELRVRRFVAEARAADARVSPGVTTTVQQWYASERAAAGSTVSVADLERVLVTTRMFALLNGAATADAAEWAMAVQLERERTQRIPAGGKRGSNRVRADDERSTISV